MMQLTCDIQKNGSTSGFIKHLKTIPSEEAINLVQSKIQDRAKTVPRKQARRSACIVGIIYDQFDGDPYLLDIVLTAIARLR